MNEENKRRMKRAWTSSSVVKKKKWRIEVKNWWIRKAKIRRDFDKVTKRNLRMKTQNWRKIKTERRR